MEASIFTKWRSYLCSVLGNKKKKKKKIFFSGPTKKFTLIVDDLVYLYRWLSKDENSVFIFLQIFIHIPVKIRNFKSVIKKKFKNTSIAEISSSWTDRQPL